MFVQFLRENDHEMVKFGIIILYLYDTPQSDDFTIDASILEFGRKRHVYRSFNRRTCVLLNWHVVSFCKELESIVVILH